RGVRGADAGDQGRLAALRLRRRAAQLHESGCRQARQSGVRLQRGRRPALLGRDALAVRGGVRRSRERSFSMIRLLLAAVLALLLPWQAAAQTPKRGGTLV